MPSTKFPIDEAQLVALFTECIFYGIYLVTFLSCIRALFFENGSLRPKGTLNYFMIYGCLWMFIVATLDVAFGLLLNHDAFIASDDDPIHQFDRMSAWPNVMKLATYVAQTFIADNILLFRCWIIYNKDWRIVILPALMWIAETVCGSIAVYIETYVGLTDTLIGGNSLHPFIISMLGLTLTTNVIVTSLMIHRIRSIQNSIQSLRVDGLKTPWLSKSIQILIESGTMYTTSVMILLATYSTGNNAAYIVSDCILQVIGITFNLIIIQVGHKRAAEPVQNVTRSLAFEPHRRTSCSAESRSSRSTLQSKDIAIEQPSAAATRMV